VEPAELARLARTRHQKTPEIHPPSDFYGNAATLKRAAGLSPRRSLSAVVEHGLVPLPRVWDLDVRAPFPTFLCAGELRVKAYEERRRGGRGIAIGPMIRYAGGGRPAAPRPPGRLLVFPTHSTHFMKAVYDVRAFARRLAAYRDRFSEITVCLYWRDVLEGADAPYRAEGFECATAGHMFDLDFLERLRGLIEEADTVVTNTFGSHVPYAVALDRPVWFIRQEVTVGGNPKLIDKSDVGRAEYHETAARITRLFEEEIDQVTPEQRQSLDPFTGFGHIRTREQIVGLLEDADERYMRSTTAVHRTWHRFVGRVARPLVARVRLP
jgi:hypothetical protein